MRRDARSTRWMLAAALVSLYGVPFPARAADPPAIALELNKLETVPAAPGQPGSCRAYIVATNPEGDETIEALRLDLVLFGTDGVISRRVALDLGPLPPGRMQVRPFDLRDQACEGLGQILVNDVMQCRVAGTDRTDCLARLRPTSRASAKLTK